MVDEQGGQYNEDYFLRGKQTGKSLYENYGWMPDLTVPMVCSIVSHLGIGHRDTILDFGCARGYVVRAFREMGYDAWGHDISQWALENADESVKEHLICNESTLWNGSFDWVIAKDVLEHVLQVEDTVAQLKKMAKVGVFAVVPLSAVDGGKYVVREYEKDVTHLHRLTLASWVDIFARPGWSVEASYRVKGVKDNYANYPTANGFITCRRLSD